MSPDPKTLRYFLLIAALLNAGTVAWWQLTERQISYESGPIENLQALILLIIFLLVCATAARASGVVRTVAITFGAASFLLLLREINLHDYNAPEWLVAARWERKLLMWLVAGSALVYVAASYRHLLNLLASNPTLKKIWDAWPFFLWIPVLAGSQLIEEWTNLTRLDNRYDFWAGGQFWEELIELNAYLIFLYGAYKLKIARYRSRSCRASAGAMGHARRPN